MTTEQEGRDPQPIIDLIKATMQDLADVAPDRRRKAINEIKAELDQYQPTDDD